MLVALAQSVSCGLTELLSVRFIANDSSVATDVSLKAICGVVPPGSVGVPAAADDHTQLPASPRKDASR